MAYQDFLPTRELKRLQEEYGDDFYIKINLLYIAFEMSELYDENSNETEFNELCEDILEISLDEQFEDYDIIDIADAAMYIISDSNYTVRDYEKTYKRNKEKVTEELLAVLNPDEE